MALTRLLQFQIYYELSLKKLLVIVNFHNLEERVGNFLE